MNDLQRAGKKIGINTLISWGASIVIIGLTFKILHWRGGEWMIGIGLLVEAGLFFLMGYASLSEREEKPEKIVQRPPQARPLDDVLAQSLDKQSLERLKNSFEQFNKTVESVNTVSGSVSATQEMLKEMEHATAEIQQLRKNLSELNNVYRAQLEAYRKA